MTRRCIRCSLVVVLATVVLTDSPALAKDNHVFAEGGYRHEAEDTLPANRFNLQPIALTAGSDFIAANVDNLLLRCSVYTGKRGVRVLLDGTIAEGPDLETIGGFPLRSQKTKKNGFAVFERTVGDVSPPPDLSSFDDPLLVAMDADIQGTKQLEEADFFCTLGSPPSPCVSDENTACLEGTRFKAKMYWKDPLNGEEREAVVKESDKKSARFIFPESNTAEERLVVLEDTCGRNGGGIDGIGSRYFRIDASAAPVEATLEVTDTRTGVVRQYGQDAVLDTQAFATCP